LKRLLHDVLGVLSNADAAQRHGKNLSLVTGDQNFKRLGICGFSSRNESRLILPCHNRDWSDRWCSFVELSYECGHGVPPRPSGKSDVLVFNSMLGFKCALNSCFAFLLPSSGFTFMKGERDRLNLAGHPRVDFQDWKNGNAFQRTEVGIRCSVQASHSTHGKRLALKGSAPRVPKRVGVSKVAELTDL
jgi:hypothetical protein